MKLKGIVVIILLAIVMLSSCKKNNIEFDELQFGYMGGFAGGGPTYIITGNGEVYSGDQNHHHITTLDEETLEEIQDMLGDLSDAEWDTKVNAGCCDQRELYFSVKHDGVYDDPYWPEEDASLSRYEDLTEIWEYLKDVTGV